MKMVGPTRLWYLCADCTVSRPIDIKLRVVGCQPMGSAVREAMNVTPNVADIVLSIPCTGLNPLSLWSVARLIPARFHRRRITNGFMWAQHSFGMNGMSSPVCWLVLWKLQLRQDISVCRKSRASQTALFMKLFHT
jgi:hypothetical protein